jgi:small-conductance mechanosensitive channel/CRP-like cAMP-binding protein
VRASDRSRFFYPFFLSVALFAAYALLSKNPRLIPSFGDMRDIFGRNLNLLLFAAWVPLIFLVVRALDVFTFDLVLSRKRRVSVPPLLRDLVALILYAILFSSAALNILKFDWKTVVPAGAVLAAVLGLALQDTLGNLFAGIALHLEDTFEVGDVIRSGEYMGRVEHVSWRGTRVRTYNNDLVVLPNSVIARERIEVFPKTNLNARVLQIGVDYHIPPATVIDVLKQAASHVEGVEREMPCIARVGSFGDSSVVYEVKYFMRDYMQRDRIDADIRKAVWYAMRRNEIAFPFPIRSFQPYAPPAHDRATLSRDEVLRRLRAVDVLEPLSDASHDAIGNAAAVHVYSKGETLIRRGGAGNSMFVIHGGTVSVRVPDENGSGVRELAQLGEGAVVGEMALLTGETRTADVVALTDVTAIEIGKAALEPELREHPDLAAALAWTVASRRDALHSVRAATQNDAQTTILSRIRDWFGL